MGRTVSTEVWKLSRAADWEEGYLCCRLARVADADFAAETTSVWHLDLDFLAELIGW